LRLGANYFGKVCQANHRLERNFEGDYQLSYKNIVRYPNLVFGFATILSLNTWKLSRYNAAA